jgi:rhodanese-related sulfurtransferase
MLNVKQSQIQAGNSMNRSQVINILGKPPYETCHILGTVSVPLADLKDYVKQFSYLDDLVVYCVHPDCYLAHQAATLLKALGYINIYIYQGGLCQWINNGFSVEGDCPFEYCENYYKTTQEPINGVKELTAQELNNRLSIFI